MVKKMIVIKEILDLNICRLKQSWDLVAHVRPILLSIYCPLAAILKEQ